MNMERKPHAHFVYLKEGKKQIDTTGKAFRHIGPFNVDGPKDTAVLHHYHTKSSNEYLKKKMRGRADIANASLGILDAKEMLNNMPARDTVFDDSAWQLLKEVAPKYQVFDDYEGWS